MRADLEELVAGVELADRFQLFLVVCDGVDVPEAFAAWLDVRLGTPVERLQAPRRAVPLTLEVLTDAVVRPLLAPGAMPVVVDLTSARAADDDAWELLYQRLNEVRNHVRDARAAPVVLCLSEHRVSVFARLAPDLWSIRSSLAMAPIEEVGGERTELTPLLQALVRLTAARPVLRLPVEVPPPAAGASESDHASWISAQLEVADALVGEGRADEARALLERMRAAAAPFAHPAFRVVRAGIANRLGEDGAKELTPLDIVYAGAPVLPTGSASRDPFELYKAWTGRFPEKILPEPSGAPGDAERLQQAVLRRFGAAESAFGGWTFIVPNFDPREAAEHGWAALDRSQGRLELALLAGTAPVSGDFDQRAPQVLGAAAAAAARRAAHASRRDLPAHLDELYDCERALARLAARTAYTQLRRFGAAVALTAVQPGIWWDGPDLARDDYAAAWTEEARVIFEVAARCGL